jgi:hypothetical protein
MYVSGCGSRKNQPWLGETKCVYTQNLSMEEKIMSLANQGGSFVGASCLGFWFVIGGEGGVLV